MGSIGSVDETLAGAVIDRRYRVLGHFGGGGMGAVYCAEHLGLGRQVALKVLRREHSDNDQFRHRFEREIRATAAIDHPNVVSVLDTGELPDGSLFYTMELLDGESLDAIFRRERRLAWSRLRGLALQLCRGLGAAHARGVVHRDLKPSNIMVISRPGEAEQVKIIDFGIAKVFRDQTTEQLTSTGSILGTLAYMSPEQIRGEGDHRIDIYALGVILYQCLAGRRPFVGSEIEMLGAILSVDPRPLAEQVDGLPSAVSTVVMRAMARNPDDRPADMRALADAIEACDAADALEPTKLFERGPRAPTAAMVRGTVPLDVFKPGAPLASPAPPTVQVPLRAHMVPRGALAGLLVLALGGGIWLLRSEDRQEPVNSPPVAVPNVESATPVERDPATTGIESTSAQPGVDETTALVESASTGGPPIALAPDDSTTGAGRSTPKKIAPDPARKLTIDEALARAARRAGEQCRSALETRLKVEVTVEPSGALRSRRVLPPHQMTSTGDCILSFLDAQRFPADPGGPTTTTLVVLPRPLR